MTRFCGRGKEGLQGLILPVHDIEIDTCQIPFSPKAHHFVSSSVCPEEAESDINVSEGLSYCQTTNYVLLSFSMEGLVRERRWHISLQTACWLLKK